MKSIFWIASLIIYLAAPAWSADIAVTIYYRGQQMTFVGPPDDTFCVARSTGLKLNADRINVPAGNYKLLCPEVVYDPTLHWIPAGQVTSLSK